MLSFYSLRQNLYCRATVRCIFVLCVLFSLLILTGCEIDNGNDPVVELDSRLIGKWNGGMGNGKDEYNITATLKLYYYAWDYEPGDDPIWGGKIVYAAKFNDTSGIIIIEYDADKKQIWMNWDTFPPLPLDPQPAGNFYGIYYDNLTQNSFVPSGSSNQETSGPSETETRQQAIDRFTLHAKTDWMNEGLMFAYTRVTE